jgi:hypothetical protein
MSNTTFKTTLAASIFAVAGTHLAIAGPDLGTIEPVQGLVFDVGANRAVAYFVPRGGKCALVLTIADSSIPSGDEGQAVTRFETTIASDHSAKYDPKYGKMLEFACHQDASALSIREIERFAERGGK